MYRLVSEAQQLAADREAEVRFGFPSLLLMEQAAAALFAELAGWTKRRGITGPWVILAGKGNNGGDGWALARYAFLAGQAVQVVQWEPPTATNAVSMADIAGRLGIPVCSWGTPEALALVTHAGVRIDALWGAGFRGPWRQEDRSRMAELLSLCNLYPAPAVAVDLPSGLWSGHRQDDPVLPAELTLALGWPKLTCFLPGLRSWCGTIKSLALGYPADAKAVAQGLEVGDFTTLVPRMPSGSHKGTRGAVALAGGAPGMSGALLLAARSAAAGGAGVVSLYTDDELVPTLALAEASFQVRPTSRVTLAKAKAWVAGPGWGRAPERAKQLETILGLSCPTVIDADGLVAWKVLVEQGFRHGGQPLVLTPHPGEWARLVGSDERSLELAQRLAGDWNCILVLKDSATWLVSADQLAVWDGQEPGLGTGGSGDCLAGLIGAYLARGLPAWQAAAAGVIAHGCVGSRLARSSGWFTASDLPGALARFENEQRQNGNKG
ncbi:MAG: NAD(P)H-hydrate dehydratase [Spirochaetales bacterium]